MSRRTRWILLAGGGLVAASAMLTIAGRTLYALWPMSEPRKADAREVLFRELQPVKLANCELERFGEPHDGGYLLCANLLGSVKSAYSYGISGYDGWGCDVSRRLGVPVHQYDCFDPTRPACDAGNTIFHEECIGSAAGVQEDRVFDTLAAQIEKNGDAGKHLVVKIDVEGAEWDSFIKAPSEVLEPIDQMAVEFHGFDRNKHLLAILKLKQFFHIAHLHWNNFSCIKDKAPFPAWAYEVLFVNKRLGVVDPSGTPLLPHPLDAPNQSDWPDCQVARGPRRTWPGN